MGILGNSVKRVEEPQEKLLHEAVETYCELLDRAISRITEGELISSGERKYMWYLQSIRKDLLDGENKNRGYWFRPAELEGIILQQTCPSCQAEHLLLKKTTEIVEGDGRFVDHSYTTSTTLLFCPLTGDTHYL